MLQPEGLPGIAKVEGITYNTTEVFYDLFLLTSFVPFYLEEEFVRPIKIESCLVKIYQ